MYHTHNSANVNGCGIERTLTRRLQRAYLQNNVHAVFCDGRLEFVLGGHVQQGNEAVQPRQLGLRPHTRALTTIREVQCHEQSLPRVNTGKTGDGNHQNLATTPATQKLSNLK